MYLVSTFAVTATGAIILAAAEEFAAELIHGLNAAEIADKNGISVHTARQHIKSLLSKNGYRKQTELVAMLVRALS